MIFFGRNSTGRRQRFTELRGSCVAPRRSRGFKPISGDKLSGVSRQLAVLLQGDYAIFNWNNANGTIGGLPSGLGTGLLVAWAR